MQLISALWFHYFSFCWFTLFRDLHYKNTWMYLNVTVIVMAQDLNQGSQLFCQRDSPETELKLWRSLKQNYQTQIRLSSSYKIQSESIKKNKCKSMLIFEKLLTKWREAFLVTWLGRIPADGDVCWRYGWCTKLCYRLKIIRGTDWMFELISGFSLEWTNIQESATVAYCCHYQWVRGCKSDDKVMTASFSTEQIVEFATIPSAYHENFVRNLDLRRESERLYVCVLYNLMLFLNICFILEAS